jgi:hypothetical protein
MVDNPEGTIPHALNLGIARRAGKSSPHRRSRCSLFRFTFAVVSEVMSEGKRRWWWNALFRTDLRTTR